MLGTLLPRWPPKGCGSGTCFVLPLAWRLPSCPRPDHGRDLKGPRDQEMLRGRKPPGRLAAHQRGPREMPEELKRLLRLQEKRFPEVLLHFRWWAAQHPGEQRPTLRPGAHDQGGPLWSRAPPPPGAAATLCHGAWHWEILPGFYRKHKSDEIHLVWNCTKIPLFVALFLKSQNVIFLEKLKGIQ